ncbi:MAG: Calx-beta domain-containing protein [Myxococcota bacterium]
MPRIVAPRAHRSTLVCASLALSLACCSDDHTTKPATPQLVATDRQLTLGEPDVNGSFMLAIDTLPSGPIELSLTSDHPDLVALVPAKVTIDANTWQTPTRIDLIVSDDAIADGPRAVAVTVTVSAGDERFLAAAPLVIGASVADDDVAALVVGQASGTTTERRGQATFEVRLASEPRATVTIPVASSDPTEGVAGSDSLSFDASDWQTPKVVVVTGQDDDVADGAVAYHVVLGPTTSADPHYQGLEPAPVALSNSDDETAGILVSKPSGSAGEDGGRASLTVSLTAQPRDDVWLALASTDEGEGTVEFDRLRFTPVDWATEKAIYVNGVDDRVDDGDQTFEVTFAVSDTTDPDYALVPPVRVALTNKDDDSAAILATAPSGATSEAGATASFDIVLGSEPTSDVTLDLVSTDPGEGRPLLDRVHFTREDWDVPQTIAVAGQDDSLADGVQAYRIEASAVSADPLYAVTVMTPVELENGDDEHIGVTVGPLVGTPTEGGGQATFTLVLESQPSGAVTIPIAAELPDEVFVSAINVTFNELDWNAPKQVLLTGKDDSAADGPTAVAIHLGPATSPSDTTGYAGLAIPDVVVHNLDDDSAGVRVGAVSGSTSEAGATATFTVVLASRPSGDVTVPIASADPDEASAVPNAIVFTRDNWSAPRTVTLRGVDDELADGPQPVRIDIGPLAAPGETTGYDGMVVAPAATNNLDDDTAGVIVSAPSGTTTEVGGSATFTVALASRPLETVTLPIASSRESEAVAQPATLSFTPDDWAAPKTVTVTGQDDDVADGNQPFLVHIGPASGSAATGYDGLVVPPVSMANLDDDSAGISVSNLGGKATEAGGEAKFTIVLLGQPQADVTIALTSSDPGEALVAPSQLVFGADDWNAPKTVRVVGQDDPLADGSQPVRVAMRVTSADPGYAGFTLADVVVPVLDDDSAGVIVGAVVGSPSESGDRATFTVVLASRPTANVVVPVLSSRPLEGAARPAQLVFTSDDWSAPQTVTVTGQDDAVADGDQPLLVDLGPAQSSDETGYAGMAIESVALVNLDDDAAGISVGALVGSASEDGDAASFTLRLRTRPTAPVTIPLRVTANGDEIRLSPPGEVVFGPDNWASPQAVTATGKDDLLADGDQVATVALGPAESDDPAFDGMVITPASIDIVNRDDDSPGVTIADFQGTPSEAGGQATFTIALRSRPAAEVRIELSSSLPGEAVVQPASIAFTAANWASPQLVITTGQDDAVADGNQPFTVRLALSSADPLYAAVSVAPLPMVNLDDDSAGVVVGPVQGTASESGDQAVFSLALRSQPTASVTLTPSTNRPDEVLVPAPLTFTTANWSAPQLVVVRGVDDATADGNQIARIDLAVSSADLRYAAVSVSSSFVVDVDDDSAGLVVGDVDGQPSERGDAATFALRLASRPTAPVTVPLSVSLPAEAALQPGALTFQPDEWSSPKLVTVTGVDDDLADGNRNLRVHIGPSSSDDARYQGLTAPSVPLVNRDDDSPSVLVGAVSGQTFEGDVDQHASFALRLGSRPTAEVRIAVTSLAPGEGTAQPALLTFAPDDWDAEQLVVVSGRDDAVADGDQRFAVALGPAASSDLGYDGLAIPTVQIVNRDDDSAGLAVSAPSGQASEAGGEASVSVRLTSRPTGNVVVPVSVSDASEAVATKAFLTFGPSNWDGLQSVSARGVDDDIADGNQPFQLVLGPVASADAAYAGIVAPPVALPNLDDDSAAVLASLPSRDVNEGGGQASFTIVLTSQPIAPVAVPVATTVNADEVLVAPTLLVFTPANWNAPQTVLVTGVDDAVKDGDQSVTLALGPATSSDARYAGASVTPPLVTLKNRDNDSAGVLVSDFQGAPNERGGQATFALALRSQPVGAVNIGLRTSDAGEGAVSPALVSFDAGDWSVPRLVTVTGVDDAEVDGNRPFSVLFDLTTSPDVAYAAVSVPPLALVNGDDDSAAVLVSGAGGQATEAGGEAVFSVSITTTPIGTVTIPLLVDDASEASLVGPSALVFSATDHAPREVRVRGVDDGLVDGDQPFAVRLGPVAAPDDPAYAALSIAPVWLTNRDDDAAAVIVSPSVGQPSEAGGSATFTVVLSAQPGGAVTVPTSSSDVSEGVVSTPSLSFTAADWSTPQTVTVTGVPDAIADGDVAFVVRLGPTASSDLRYHGLQPPDVRLVNRDDGDAVGIVAVLPPTGLAVAESGTSASFTLRLASQPVANVVLPLASSDVSEIVVQPTTLVFTASNWQTPQVVTVRGVDDRLVDGPATATIGVGPALSADAGYAGLTPGASIVATNADDDSGSVTTTVIGQASEAGSAAYLTVALTAAPRDVVVLAIASGDAGEIAVSPPVVSFGANNWDVAQTVELRGVDDALADGPQATTITVSASSSDPAFAGKSATAIVTTLDDDSAAVIVSDVSGEPSEAGASATFSVRLATQPSAPVVVELATASDEVAIDGQPSRALTLTPSDWAVPHLVRVLGLDDAEDDGDQEAVVDLAVSSNDPAYANLSLSPIVVTNRDDDTRGVIVGPPQGQPTEFGGSASFTVRLATRPTAPVSITPNSTRPAEAAVSGPLTFTAASWQTPQTVTVTGQDDGDQDGDQALAVRLVAAGGDYADIAIADVPFVNRDNDSGAGISVRVVSGAPDERGGQALVGVRLNSQPASAVTLAIASSDTGEGSVSLAALAFDAQSWSHEKTFVVTGVDDAFADGDRSFVVTLDPASSTDPAYRGLAAVSLPLANRDDDVAGVSVSTPVGQPSEAGASASFTVAPTSRPRVGQDLTVAVASSAPSEATVTPSTLVFTASDWAARTVTVTGRDDDLDDGDQPLAVTLGPVASADAAYAGREIAPLQFVNLDDDSAGLEVAVVGSATGEAAGAGVVTITVRLDAAPRQNVSVPLRVSDPSEASLDKAVLVLDAVNWRSGATATVTGQDDAVADGDVAYQIDLGPVASNDALYAGRTLLPVRLVNRDDGDRVGVSVSRTTVTTSEDRAAAPDSFTVVLDSAPTANVVLPLASSDPSEAAVSPSALEFTPLDWSVPRTVTVTGQDDAIQDGAVDYRIALGPLSSADPAYGGRTLADVTGTNLDHGDVRGVMLGALVGQATEAGGSATFTVALGSEPTAPVSIAATITTGASEAFVAPAALVFTAASWSTPQEVRITGRDDATQDGDAAVVVRLTPSSTGDYAGLAPLTLATTNRDDDAASVAIGALQGAPSESGGAASFTVRLGSQPSGDVSIAFGDSDLDDSEVTIAPPALVFTAVDWASPRTVTVTGRDDDTVDGDQAVTIAPVASGGGYDGTVIAPIVVTNRDDDQAGVSVRLVAGPTTEAGGAATIMLRLNAAPTGSVIVDVASSDPSEGSVATAALTFSAADWSSEKALDVRGVDDAVADGDQAYLVTLAVDPASTDARYRAVGIPSIPLVNSDDDAVGVTVLGLDLRTSETDGSDAGLISVALRSQPTAPVTVRFRVSDPSEASARGPSDPDRLTFTEANWMLPQLITVTGVDDAMVDGDVGYALVFQSLTSADAAYAALAPAAVELVNVDGGDASGLAIVGSDLETGESGGDAAAFSIALTSQPSAPVTLPVASSDLREGVASPATLVFTPSSWSTPQLVTVAGQNDAIDDGDVGYALRIGPSTSADPAYAGLHAERALVNHDDDTRGLSLGATLGAPDETGARASLTVALATQPTDTVTVRASVAPADEADVAPAVLTFTSSDWNQPRTLTVTGKDDAEADGAVPLTVRLAADDSGGYGGVVATRDGLTNADDDTAGFRLTPVVGQLDERGGLASFTLALRSQPTGDVQVDLALTDAGGAPSGEAAFRPAGGADASLLFRADASWSVPQTVVLAGLDDARDDGDQPVRIRFGVSSSDAVYAARSIASLTLSNLDDDARGVLVGAAQGTPSELGGSATIALRLTSEPSAGDAVLRQQRPGRGRGRRAARLHPRQLGPTADRHRDRRRRRPPGRRPGLRAAHHRQRRRLRRGRRARRAARTATTTRAPASRCASERRGERARRPGRAGRAPRQPAGLGRVHRGRLERRERGHRRHDHAELRPGRLEHGAARHRDRAGRLRRRRRRRVPGPLRSGRVDRSGLPRAAGGVDAAGHARRRRGRRERRRGQRQRRGGRLRRSVPGHLQPGADLRADGRGDDRRALERRGGGPGGRGGATAGIHAGRLAHAAPRDGDRRRRRGR